MHNFIGLRNKIDNFRKGLFTDPYDEPTFLTFALDFKFETEPAVVGYEDSKLWTSPLFNGINRWGAASFLNSRSYKAQAQGLSVFKEILRYLTTDAPWYFQSIEGLEKLRSQSREISKGWKTKDLSITVNTLEAIDLRIQELAELYTNAIFDLKYRRERVPDNLRWFSMDIYVAEFRNLRWEIPGTQGLGGRASSALGINAGALGEIGGLLTSSNVLEQFGYMKFSCRQCEFDFTNTFAAGAKLSVGDKPTAANNKFSIKIGWVDEEYKFGDGSKVFDDPHKTDIRNPWGMRNIGENAQNVAGFLTGLPIVGDDIGKQGQRALNALSKIGGFVNPALEAATRFVRGADTWDEVFKGTTNLDTRYGPDVIKKAREKILPIAPGSDAYSDRTETRPEPVGDVYPDIDRPRSQPNGDVYSEPVQSFPEPKGDVYPVLNVTKPLLAGDVYPGSTAPRTEPDGDVYPGTNSPRVEPSGDVYPGTERPRSEPAGDVYPGRTASRDEPVGDVYPDRTASREEPSDDIYPGTTSSREEPVGDVYPGTTASREEPSGEIYTEGSRRVDLPNGSVYSGRVNRLDPPDGDVYSTDSKIISPPNGNIYPIYNPIPSVPNGNVYPNKPKVEPRPDGDVYP